MGCKKHKFGLNHSDPDLFHRSQWDGQGKPSNWYVAYRVVLAGLMLAGVIAHIVNYPDVRWIIFMTDQGITLLTIHYLPMPASCWLDSARVTKTLSPGLCPPST